MWRGQLAAVIACFTGILSTCTYSITSSHLLHYSTPFLHAEAHTLWLYLAAVPAYTSHRVCWRWPSPGDINISGSLSGIAHGRTQAAQSPGGGADGGTEQEGEGWSWRMIGETDQVLYGGVNDSGRDGEVEYLREVKGYEEKMIVCIINERMDRKGKNGEAGWVKNGFIEGSEKRWKSCFFCFVFEGTSTGFVGVINVAITALHDELERKTEWEKVWNNCDDANDLCIYDSGNSFARGSH